MAYTILPYVSQGTDITSVRTNTIRDNFTWMKDNLVPLAVAAQHEKKVLVHSCKLYTLGAATTETTVITFGYTFATVPTVLLSMHQGVALEKMAWWEVVLRTKTNFTARIGLVNGGTFGSTTPYAFEYLAVG